MNMMKEGLKVKFVHNVNLRNFLLSTKGKGLVEASVEDLIWGSGITLRDHDKMVDSDFIIIF